MMRIGMADDTLADLSRASACMPCGGRRYAYLDVLGVDDTTVALEVVVGTDSATLAVGGGNWEVDEPSAGVGEHHEQALTGLEAAVGGDEGAERVDGLAAVNVGAHVAADSLEEGLEPALHL